jgi:hypothetical protein
MGDFFSKHPETKLFVYFCYAHYLGQDSDWVYSKTYQDWVYFCYPRNVIIHAWFMFCPFFSGLQCRKRKLKVSVVAVPKTIDNDILFMDKTFGFDTAVEEAQRAINSAYIEVSCITPSCGFQNAVK